MVNKKPTWTKIKDGYRSNMSVKELNDYQTKTGKQVYPPNSMWNLKQIKIKKI